MKKTNAARQLDELGIPYELLSYEVDESDLSAPTVAAKIGLEASQTFKTLVALGDCTGVLLACVPGDAELDLKALARASANKRVELVPLKQVQPLTGYIRGAVSPLGLMKPFAIFLDELALAYERITVSAGQRGLQMYLNPEDLQRATQAVLAELCRYRPD